MDADVGEPLDGREPLLRRRDAALNLPGLLRVCGNDADFDVPVVRVPGEKLHVAAVLRPPRRLRREGQRVVDFVKVAEELEGDAVPALVFVEFVREAAPLHDAPVLDVLEELHVRLVRRCGVVDRRILKQGDDLLRVHAARLAGEVAFGGVAFLKEREAVEAVIGTPAVCVHAHRHGAVRDFHAPPGARIVLLELFHLPHLFPRFTMSTSPGRLGFSLRMSGYLATSSSATRMTPLLSFHASSHPPLE